MQKKTPHRAERVSAQLIKDLSKLIAQEVRHSNFGFVTVQAVTVSQDYSHAKIYVSILGDEAVQQKSLAILNQKSGYLHGLLYKMWRIHTIPQLHFFMDDTQAKGFAMDALIQEAIGRSTPTQD